MGDDEWEIVDVPVTLVLDACDDFNVPAARDMDQEARLEEMQRLYRAQVSCAGVVRGSSQQPQAYRRQRRGFECRGAGRSVIVESVALRLADKVGVPLRVVDNEQVDDIAGGLEGALGGLVASVVKGEAVDLYMTSDGRRVGVST